DVLWPLTIEYVTKDASGLIREPVINEKEIDLTILNTHPGHWTGRFSLIEQEDESRFLLSLDSRNLFVHEHFNSFGFRVAEFDAEQRNLGARNGLWFHDIALA